MNDGDSADLTKVKLRLRNANRAADHPRPQARDSTLAVWVLLEASSRMGLKQGRLQVHFESSK